MDWNPAHRIEIIHRWIEVDKIESTGGCFTTISNCRDCGVEQPTLVLEKPAGQVYVI